MGSASAALGRLFLELLFLGGLLGFLFSANCAVRGGPSAAFARLLLGFLGAHGAGLGAASAAAGRLFHLGATCTRLGPSAAAGMGAGHGHPSHAQQAGDTEAGKILFQLFSIHSGPPDENRFMKW